MSETNHKQTVHSAFGVLHSTPCQMNSTIATWFDDTVLEKCLLFEIFVLFPLKEILSQSQLSNIHNLRQNHIYAHIYNCKKL